VPPSPIRTPIGNHPPRYTALSRHIGALLQADEGLIAAFWDDGQPGRPAGQRQPGEYRLLARPVGRGGRHGRGADGASVMNEFPTATMLLAMLFSLSVRALLVWDSWRIGP